MKQHYQYLPIVAVFYSIAMVSSGLLTYKFINVFGIVACGASFIVPIWYLLGDVITEVYGYRICRRLIWATLVAYIFYAALIKITINLPPPPAWNLQNEYQDVLGIFLRVSLAGTIASLIGGFANSYLLSKWKILLRGKHFSIRSLGSSIIGQFLFVILVNFTAFSGNVSVNEILQIMIISMLIKIICSAICIIPSSFLVVFLKNKEKIDVFDNNINYNPFKLF